MAIIKPVNMQVRELIEFTQGLLNDRKEEAKKYPALCADKFINDLEKFVTIKVKLELSLGMLEPPANSTNTQPVEEPQQAPAGGDDFDR